MVLRLCHGCWDPNLGLLEELHLFLAAEPSLQLLRRDLEQVIMAAERVQECRGPLHVLLLFSPLPTDARAGFKSTLAVRSFTGNPLKLLLSSMFY